MDQFFQRLLVDLDDILMDIEYDLGGTDDVVPYKKLKDLIQSLEEHLEDNDLT